MITKVKQVVLKTGEVLTYWQSSGGTYTVDVQFSEVGPIVASATSGAFPDTLATLAARFKTFGIELDNLATPQPRNPKLFAPGEGS